MCFLKSLASWVLSVLFNLLLALAMLGFHVFLVLAKPLGYRAYIQAYHLVAGTIVNFLYIAGCRPVISRKVALAQGRPLIVVSNHQSVYDIPLICWGLRDFDVKFVAKRALGSFIPAVSHAIRNSGCLLIDRDNPRQAVPAMREFGKRAGEEKYAVSIFPEGTRARDGVMKKFKAAGLQLLLRSMPSALVLPAVVKNSWKLVEHKQFPMPFGARIELCFLEPVEPGSMPEEQLIAHVESVIRAELGQA